MTVPTPTCTGCFSPSHRCPYCGTHVVPVVVDGELQDPGCCDGDPEADVDPTCPDCGEAPCHPQCLSGGGL